MEQVRLSDLACVVDCFSSGLVVVGVGVHVDIVVSRRFLGWRSRLARPNTARSGSPFKSSSAHLREGVQSVKIQDLDWGFGLREESSRSGSVNGMS
jgi:hypothetical protein